MASHRIHLGGDEPRRFQSRSLPPVVPGRRLHTRSGPVTIISSDPACPPTHGSSHLLRGPAMTHRNLFPILLLAALSGSVPMSRADAAEGTKQLKSAPKLVRSARGGAWSAAATWEGGRVPTAGDKVQVRTGHAVVYDVRSDQVLRS